MIRDKIFISIINEFLFCLVFLFIVCNRAHSAEFIITSVVRDFPMRAGDSIVKDYYINAGTNNGLKNGVYIDAVRKLAAYDNINLKLIGDTQVKIGKLKLIHVDKNLSIARLVKMYDKEKDIVPMTGFDDVMIGDAIVVSDKQR